jgi:hypothetical protein
MSWVKRNLYFVILSGVALLLMGLAGWFLYSKWDANNKIVADLNSDYQVLQELSQKNPHPGFGSIDNDAKAKEQREELRAFIKKALAYFQPIPPIPEIREKLTDHDVASALTRTIAQLQQDATNASITIPPNYAFSFEAQKSKISLAAGSHTNLAHQVGEVKAICDILFQAKINSLDNVRRERLSTDDNTGPQTDYLGEKTVTNELAILTQYEVTFRSFSSELAAVLGSFAASPYGLIVKSINVEPAPAPPAQEQTTPPALAYPMPGAMPYSGYDRDAMRAMMRYGPMAFQQPVAQPVAPPRTGLPTVLDEKQLKVTLNVIVEKLLTPK